MTNKIILLIEDNPDDQVLTLRAFKRFKSQLEVVVMRDGAEALDYVFGRGKYQNQPHYIPELILLDLKLPKLNGIEVLKSIRADERTKLVPVIMLSSSLEEQDLINSYDYGCNSYIRKPIDFLEFMEVMQQLGLYWLGLNEQPPKNTED
jgi:two-component system response regulator